MNESILTQLKIIVERAVRPVRATLSRKRRMREELLAHVTAVFEEEATKLGDECAALESTRLRFGNSAELTDQLQKSAPHGEQQAWSMEAWVLAQGRSTSYFAIRNVLFYLALLVLSALINLLVGEAPSLIARFFMAQLVVCLVIFAFTFLTHWMRQALNGVQRRSWLKVAGVGVAAMLLMPMAIFGYEWIFRGHGWSSSTDFLVTLYPLYVPVPAFLVALMWLESRWVPYQREWDILPIDAGNGVST